MQNSYKVTGTLTDGSTVELDQALPLRHTKVRLYIEPLLVQNPIPYAEVVAEIRRRQQARGHVAPTRAEVDAHLLQERSSWGE
ncbi:MAG: hypothetical protein L0387_17210 [Acidobacteria bacterium]|nr:hypothetical protein [Acidobacteriota bacterium]MCI0623370.1 hypothetical protein [Acidobacteriota bacterium]MCI0721603.1 hypothetical protein [Acidobacteriota bacterium]